MVSMPDMVAIGCTSNRLGKLRHAVRDGGRPPRQLVRM